MRFVRTFAALVVVGSAALTSPPVANAAPLVSQPGVAASMPTFSENVQYRRYGYGGGYGRGYGYGRRSYGGGGALLGGLAAGAIIGGAIAAGSAANAANDSASYCAQRYRSYDPASGTYLNNDGNRYACP